MINHRRVVVRQHRDAYSVAEYSFWRVAAIKTFTSKKNACAYANKLKIALCLTKDAFIADVSVNVRVVWYDDEIAGIQEKNIFGIWRPVHFRWFWDDWYGSEHPNEKNHDLRGTQFSGVVLKKSQAFHYAKLRCAFINSEAEVIG